MRARPREINIFNMSLLDILCGALGAFCFMMLVALPYYVAGTPDRAQDQKRTEELMKDVEKLRERMSDPSQAEELRKLIDELQAQIQKLQGQVNQYAYENEQLKKESARLTSENNELTEENMRLNIQHSIDEIEAAKRRPFLVLGMSINVDQDISLFLEDEMVDGASNKKNFANPAFDPNTLTQTGWPNDLNVFVPRHGVTAWVSSTTKPKSIYRVFVKYRMPATEHTPFSRQQQPTRVILSCIGSVVADRNHGTVALAPERPWTLAGTVQIDEKGQISYKDATEGERDEAWRAIAKSDVPTPAPTATPSPGGSLSPEDMQRLRQKAAEERRRIETSSPSPAPSR